MPRLTYHNGAAVSVSDETATALLTQGFTLDKGEKINEPDTGYSTQKVDDLRAEIDRRNQGRDEADALSTEGKKADLVAALEADDSAAK